MLVHKMHPLLTKNVKNPTFLGASVPYLGPLDHFWGFWARFGAFYGPLGRIWTLSRPDQGPLDHILARIWVLYGPNWNIFRAYGPGFG